MSGPQIQCGCVRVQYLTMRQVLERPAVDINRLNKKNKKKKNLIKNLMKCRPGSFLAVIW